MSTPHQTKKDVAYEASKAPHTGESAQNCSTKDNNEGTDSLIMRGSNIRDLYSSCLNNIMFKKTTPVVDKPLLARLTHQFEAVQQLFTSEIKEELPCEVKELVLGTFFNLTYTHHKLFSLPKQVAAEYVFALTNVTYYLPHVTCFKHRNNILSKMIRHNVWKTPKGFYNYFYLGQQFKDKQDLRAQRIEEHQDQKRGGWTLDESVIHDERLVRLEEQMVQQSSLVDALTQKLHQQTSEEEVEVVRAHIQSTRLVLEDLWRQQKEVEHALSLERCA